MKVSYFPNVKDNIQKGRAKDVLFYLDRIRNGDAKKQVDEVRAILDKAERNERKKQILGNVTFCGEFKKRSKSDLVQASGLAILDADDFKTYQEVLETKQKLIQDPFVFACWISCSGLGLKFLLRIPTVENDDEYKSFYSCIVNHFNWIKLDESGKDICRMSYESYDSDIYVNTDSNLFVDFIPTEVATYDLQGTANIPLTDQDEIANRLMVWFKKTYNGQNRNNSFHKLALAFNDYGVAKYVAEKYILPNEQKDFRKDEIKALINSAYKHTHQHGSKSFEDKVKVKAIQNMALVGKSDHEIKTAFPDIKEEALLLEVENQRKILNIDEFWTYTEKGVLKLSPHKYKFYLENKNYFKHYPNSGSNTFTFITKEDNFVDEVYHSQIKDYVLNDLIGKSLFDQFDLMASSGRAFNPDFLSMLDTAKFQVEKDTKDFAMIYYKNVALRIFKDRIEKIAYDDLDGFVWKKQVIDRVYNDFDHHESEYRSFIWFASGQDKSRYDSLKSVIGYLMHSYKTNANNLAVVFNDETISDDPNGRSGKSLFWNALKHLKKVTRIDGKTFEFSKTFPYQTVPIDCQILVFDDIKKDFKFENLFSVITEGITLEYKGQNPITLPVSDSPKILITTNYTLKGSGGSHEARKFEIEMSSYFSVNHTPMDEFGHMLFDEWDNDEWQRFDNFMVYCLQYYLKNGLVKPNYKNLALRKFVNDTCQEFYEFVNDGNIPLNTRHTKSVIFDALIEEHKDLKKWITMKRFNSWLKSYANLKQYKYVDGNTNGKRWFTYEYEPKQQPTESEDVCDELNSKAGF